MGKKKNNDIAKRQSKAKQKKHLKRKAMLSERNPEPEPHTIYRPPLTEMGAPNGYRSISFSQALLEFGKPLMKYDNKDNVEAAFKLSSILWNYSISVRDKHEMDKNIDNAVIDAVRQTLNINQVEAENVIKEMVERYYYLFPPDIQPMNSQLMFIRIEVPAIIRKYDYNSLVILNDVVPSDEDDTGLISEIMKLDEFIKKGSDYGEYDKLLYAIRDKSEVRFKKWLIDKEIDYKEIEEFVSCINLYISFIYGHMHDNILLFKNISLNYLDEFFHDFLLRKLYVDNPNEYVYYPPSIKLFYRFLYEKEYIESYKNIEKKIDDIEHIFIKSLQKQFM